MGLQKIPGGGLAIVLGLLCLLPHIQAATSSPTHICSLSISGKQVDLSCRQQAGSAAALCDLVVYYNRATMSGSPPTFGVRAKPLPSEKITDWKRAEQYPITALNLTEPTYKVTYSPMLLFHGSRSCTVQFDVVNIRGVRLTENNPLQCPCDRSMAVAFGGGLSATISSGKLSSNVATHVLAVLANSSLAIHDTSIINNSASGAVTASWSSTGLELSHCTFKDNRGPSDRAAVSAIKTNVSINSCDFVNNTAGNAGPALHTKFSNVTVRGSNFSLNEAPQGGAVALYDMCNMLIDDCRFANNTASRSVIAATDLDGDAYKLGVGGAVYARSSLVNITDSTFTGNKALINGGAILVQLTELQRTNRLAERLLMQRSSLTDNLAYRHGAAIYVGADKKVRDPRLCSGDPFTVFITDSVLRGNRAQANGGGIMLQPGATLEVINSNITFNSAWISGGGVATELGEGSAGPDDGRTNMTFRGVTFLNNTGSGRDVYAGPNFAVNFTDTCNIYPWSHSVTWFKRNCTWGEYRVASGFCELCPAFTWASNQTETKCQQKPPFTYAPGGAVVIPLPFYYHGNRPTTRHWCEDCQQEGRFRLADVIRCPNPAACIHDEIELAYRAPTNGTVPKAQRMPWREYGEKLCTADTGYTGVMCGVCKAGYGATAPFTCYECVQSQDRGTGGRAKISMLYILYWAVLTVWFLFTSWTAVLSKANRKSAGVGAADQLSASVPAKDGATVVHISSLAQEDSGKACSNAQSVNAPTGPKETTAGIEACSGSPSCTEQLGSHTCCPHAKLRLPEKYRQANMMDVTKAIIIYWQWVILILNLPIIWLPEQLANEQAASIGQWGAKQAQQAGQKVLGVLLGRFASLDCLMEAWGKWTGDNAKDISSAVMFKAAANLIIIPLILFLSVAAIQCLWWHVRGWLVQFVLRRKPARSRSAFRSLSLALWPAGSKRFAQHSGQSPTLRGLGAGGNAADSTNSTATNTPAPQSSLGTWQGKSLGTYMFEHMVAAVLALIFYYYSNFARTALGLLFCVKLGTSRRWVMDVRLQCPLDASAQAHRVGALLLGIPALMFCIIWPIGIAIVLLHAAHKGKLYGARVDGVKSRRDRFRAMLVFRYADYDVDYDAFTADGAKDRAHGLRGVSLTELQHVLVRNMVLTWDSVLDLIRFMLALISLCVVLHEIHQLALVLLVLSIYMLLVLVVRPWRSPAVQLFQVLGLVVLLLSCLGIMACAVREADTNYHASLYRPVLSWSVVVLNILYMAASIVILGWCVVKQLKQVAPTVQRLWRHWKSVA